jgi:ATP-dependent protease HslVU (ClpYQ) peptidase subunit
MTNAEIVARNNAAAKRLARLEGLARFAGTRASEMTLSAAQEKEIEARLQLIDYDLGLTEKEVLGLAALFANDDDFRKS